VKRGIVLMMTLGFITVISVLILYFLKFSKIQFENVTRVDAQNQFATLFKDFTKMIKSFDINSSEGLDLFLSVSIPRVAESKSGVGVGFEVESLMSKLNINNILYQLSKGGDFERDPIKEEYLRRPIEKFLAKFELSDPFLFIDILLDSIDSDDFPRGAESEIVNEEPDFTQGEIYDFDHFQKIKDYYFKRTKDEKIFKITRDEFEKFFYFGEVKKYGMLDCSKLDLEGALSLIVNDEMVLAQDTDYCKESNSSSMKKLKKIYNISQYTKKKKYLVKCIIYLDTENYQRAISFDYDVNSKRISNIDKNYQQK
jgi:hypothetical protein